DHPSLGEVPVIVHASDELSKKDDARRKHLAQTTALRDVRSLERLVDDVALFLHRPLAALSDEHRQTIERLHDAAASLGGKKVLVVDDDIRNIVAMTDILEPLHMAVVAAETGTAAIAKIQEHPDVDVVLMDIMMPDMDGYDTMRAIRKLSRFRGLP